MECKKKNKWKRKWDEKQNINCRRCCVDKLHLWKVFAAVNNDNDRYALTAQNIWNKNMVKKHEMILAFYKYTHTYIYIYTSAKRNYLPTYIYIVILLYHFIISSKVEPLQKNGISLNRAKMLLVFGVADKIRKSLNSCWNKNFAVWRGVYDGVIIINSSQQKNK